MAKTLIETPFPSTAEVAKKLGLSRERVREVEKIVYDNSTSSTISSKSEPKSEKRNSGKTGTPSRNGL